MGVLTKEGIGLLGLMKADATKPRKTVKLKGPKPELDTDVDVTEFKYEDRDYMDVALQIGLRVMACEFDGLNSSVGHTRSEFSPHNHFAHIALRKYSEPSPADVI